MESQPSDSNPIDTNSFPSSECNLCGRLVQSVTNDPEIFSLCGHCKYMLLEDYSTPTAAPAPPPPPLPHRQTATRRIRRRRRRRRRLNSLESNLINLSTDERTSSHTTPNSSTRWRRIFSESESEDTESNASFTLYRFAHGGAYSGGESDASTGFMNAGTIDFDTDIDPMHAGIINQWTNSDEESEWEEEEEDEEIGVVGETRYRNYLSSPSESYSSSVTRFDTPDLDREFRQRIIQRRQALSRNIFTSLEDIEFSPYITNIGDSLDERGFEELLEQLAESENGTRGAPPASVSCVRELPKVVIREEHVKKGLLCAVCKEVFNVGNETTELPCCHLYHGYCIVPWLSSRNSCPLCRYELPTDDKDYEEGKVNVVGVSEDRDSSSDGDDVTEEEYVERGESSEVGVRSIVSRGRWLFRAAVPVVSLMGVMLAMWLSNPQRRNIVFSTSQRGNRTRRWLPFF